MKVWVECKPTMYFILYIHIAGVDHRSTLPLAYFRDNVQTFAESIKVLNFVPHPVFISTVECGNQTSVGTRGSHTTAVYSSTGCTRLL